MRPARTATGISCSPEPSFGLAARFPAFPNPSCRNVSFRGGSSKVDQLSQRALRVERSSAFARREAVFKGDDERVFTYQYNGVGKPVGITDRAVVNSATTGRTVFIERGICLD
jgi:hypothetical protein